MKINLRLEDIIMKWKLKVRDVIVECGGRLRKKGGMWIGLARYRRKEKR